MKAFWREAHFPSLRRRHFASSWARVLAGQTLPSCLCANIEESTEAIIHRRGSSMWLSMFRSRVNTLSGVTDDQSITFDVHYISLTYTALTGAISLTQTIRSVRQGTSPQYQKCYLNLVIWYWYRYLSAQPIISNSEAAMLSKIKGRLFQNILSYSVNLEGPLLEPARSRQIK